MLFRLIEFFWKFSRAVSLRLLLLLVIATFSQLPAAVAEPIDKTTPSNGWTFRFAPYVWAIQVDGQVGLLGQRVDVDVDFIDVVDAADELTGWISYIEARRGPLWIYLDFIYADLTFTEDAATSLRVLPGFTLSLSANGKLRYEYAIAEGGIGHELARWGTEGSRQDAVTTVDAIVGGRYWYQKLDLALDIDGTLTGPLPGFDFSGGLAVSGARRFDWIDPFIGLQLRHAFNQRSRLTLRADVGGFGVGSDFSWQAAAYFEHQIGGWRGVDFSAVIGYRALYVDYNEGSGLNAFEYDALHHGILLGVSAQF